MKLKSAFVGLYLVAFIRAETALDGVCNAKFGNELECSSHEEHARTDIPTLQKRYNEPGSKDGGSEPNSLEEEIRRLEEESMSSESDVPNPDQETGNIEEESPTEGTIPFEANTNEQVAKEPMLDEVQLDAVYRCPALKRLSPPITTEDAAQYNAWWLNYGYPILGEPAMLMDRLTHDTTYQKGTVTDPNFDFYRGFIDKFHEGTIPDYLDPSLGINWLQWPIPNKEAGNYGCGAYKLARKITTPEGTEKDIVSTFCELRKSSAAVVSSIKRTTADPEFEAGKYVWFAREPYRGLGSWGYKALDWFIFNRNLKSSFTWAYRACGVKKPAPNQYTEQERFDMYIGLRFDIAARSPEDMIKGHGGVKNPHLQAVIIMPRRKDAPGDARWHVWHLKGAWPVPGECLMKMLQNKDFPCPGLYEDIIRPVIGETVAPWRGYKDTEHKPWQNSVPHWGDLEPIGEWERMHSPDELGWNGSGWGPESSLKLKYTFDKTAAW